MIKSCLKCADKFEVTADDLKFYDQISPVFGGKKFAVPAPSLCPDCRQRRRLAWRNERTLYSRKCDATGKDIISVFSPDKNLLVFENDYWYGDEWDAKSYGRDFDFSRPFFEQFAELLAAVPQLSRSAVGNQNSDYVNQAGWCKNCYLIFEADYNESCYYSNYIYNSNFCADCFQVTGDELCYECVDCAKCYNLKYAQNCNNCSDSWFLKSCIGCSHCFGCVNLRNKQYFFFNEKLSKVAYEAKIAEYNSGSFSAANEMKKEFADFALKYPEKDIHGVQNENCSGDYLNNTKNCHSCFDIQNAQDCKYVYNSRNIRNVYDMTVFGSMKGADFCYENHALTHHMIFSHASALNTLRIASLTNNTRRRNMKNLFHGLLNT
jgi:hypothetical protein